MSKSVSHISQDEIKIAVLITAYKNENQLQKLVMHLATDFDVYVHIDTCSKINLRSAANVFVFKIYKTYWGSINTVLAVLYLLARASEKSYDRYIQITGQDMPIKSNSHIRQFYSNNKNKEYIECFVLPSSRWSGNGGFDRVNRFWPIEDTHLGGWRKFIGRLLNNLHHLLYNSALSRFFLRKIDHRFYGGSNYMDLTKGCVQQILEFIDKNPNYIKRFKYTRIPEEMFFQTIVMTLSDVILDNHVSRYIDWTTGPEYPRIFDSVDYARITNSSAMFARKFDESKECGKIIEALYAYVKRFNI